MSRTSIRKLIRNIPVGVFYLTDKLALENSFIVTDTSKQSCFFYSSMLDIVGSECRVSYDTAPVEQRVMSLAQGPNSGSLMVFQEQLACAVHFNVFPWFNKSGNKLH